MRDPVHFDITAMRETYAVTNAKALADARSKAKTPGDLRGIDLQERFLDLLVEGGCIVAQARNDGFDEFSIGKAFGLVVGNLSGNYMANMLRHGRPDVAMVMYEQVSKLIELCLAGNSSIPGMSSASANFAGTPGGHA